MRRPRVRPGAPPLSALADRLRLLLITDCQATESPIRGATPTESPIDGATPTESPIDGATPTESPIDGATPTESPLPDRIAAACRGGVTAVMLREDRDLPTAEVVRRGRQIRAVCRDAGVTFIVNHHCEAAAELSADGVHLGYRSVPEEQARLLMGDAALIGRSTHDLLELKAAKLAGADYVTYGPIHDTPSKRGLKEPRGWAGLRAAVRCAGELPVVALGGLGPADAAPARASGAAGAAAIRALLSVADPEAAARAFCRGWGSA